MSCSYFQEPSSPGAARAGFTLREMLFVLLLLVAVTAVLFPMMARAHEKARQAACASNERQLALGLIMYAQDNDGVFPGAGGPGWCGAAFPYIMQQDAYHCPDDFSPDPQAAPASSASPRFYAVSYGLNSNLSERRNDPHNPVPAFWIHPAASTATMTSPAQTVLLFEVSNAQSPIAPHLTPQQSRSMAACSPTGNLDMRPDGRYPSGCPIDMSQPKQIFYATGAVDGRPVNNGLHADPRHQGGSNFVACDAHCYWFRPEQVCGGANAAAPNSAPASYSIAPGQISYRAAGAAACANMTFSTR